MDATCDFQKEKKEKGIAQKATASHAYQIIHFLIKVLEQTGTQSILFVCVHVFVCVCERALWHEYEHG